MATVNGIEINLMPTDGMKAEAERYRAWKKEGRAGGTSVAARRATQILSGNELSPSVVITMSAWFARHEVDKQGQGYKPGHPAYPSPGRVAWAAWGGDAGQTWATAKAETIKRALDRLHNNDQTLTMSSTQQRELTPDLMAPQVALYEALEEIVDNLGQFDQGSGAHGAHYMPNNPFVSEGMQCANCAFYAGPRACEIVSGEIDPAAICKFWIIPEKLMGAAATPPSTEDASSSPPANRAAPDALKVGDFVSWQSSGGTARGRIEHIMREGVLGVPDSSFSIQASSEDPAALIRIYRASGDTWNETETLVGHRFSTLSKIAPLDRSSDLIGTESRPYPNEHAARLLDPAQFDRFRRKNDEFGQGIDAIYGISGSDPVKLQALRFSAARFTVSEAKKWLSDHDYKPIIFEPATGDKSMTPTIDIKSISKEVHRREAPQGLRVEESTDTGLTFSFSSEAPVERWWGREVLMHDAGAMDLNRMNDGGPWLWNHNRDVVLGVAEKAWLGDDRRLYVKTKWSPNTTEKGTEEYKRRKDIEAGIVRNVSFAYEINDVREATTGEMQVTKWNVLEVSSVSVPADQTVGLGRAHDPGEPTASPLTTQEAIQASTSTLELMQPAERGTDTPQNPPSMEQAINVQEVQSAARQSERERVAAIRAMCDQHQVGTDLADRLINDDATIDQAREAVLTQISRTRSVVPSRVQSTSDAIGLSDQQVQNFSFVRALNYLINPGDRAAREAAAFEIEVGKAASEKYQRSSNGIVIPNEVLRRDLVVGTSTAGGNLVPTDLLSGSFIDLLRNRMAMMQAGVTMLSGLQGNVSIPRQTSAATAYWVGENSSPTESQQAIDQVNMTPKTVGAFVDYSRRLLLQSSIDVEAMIRSDLAKVIALELDRAAIYGTGSTNQPLGLTNTTGIGTQTISTFGTFAEYIGMETDVASANADAGALRYIINASARGALKSTEKSATSTGMFVYDNDQINGYPVIVSNQLQSNDCLFGDFSQFVVGMWSGLDLTVDPYAGSTAGTVRIIALQDVDFAVKQPSAFCYGT